MDLIEPTEEFQPIRDPRPHLPEPPPVRLVAIADVHATCPPGIEKELDGFYVELLKFHRDPDETARPAYRAENHRVLFDVIEGLPARDDYRPVQVQIPHFNDFLDALRTREIDFELQRGVAPGMENILMRDPGGNWVQIMPWRTVR